MRDYKETSGLLRGLAVSLQVIDSDYARLCDVAADAIEELQARNDKQTMMIRKQSERTKELLAAVPKWISVKERLPEVDERVLACVGIPGKLSVWDGVRWNGEEWEAEEEAVYDYWTTIDDPVTHWMPLPAPPKEVE